jgi:hypothetical protein
MRKATIRPQKLENFFQEYLQRLQLNNINVFFCRHDGILLYRQNTLTDQLNESSIGALLGGVWQAAQAIAGFLPPRQENEVFRLSFDTSGRGLYILPYTLQGQDYYLASIYDDQINPGALKLRLRDLMTKLDEFLNTSEVDSSLSKGENQYLFRDITDEEINKLFAFSGKL